MRFFSRPWSVVLAGACLLSSTFLPALGRSVANQGPETSQAPARQGKNRRNQDGSGPPCAAADASRPAGLVVVIIDKPQARTLDLEALKNPCVSGAALQIHWAELEPEQGKPDWSKLDQLFAAARSSNKWVQLLIFPGFFSPAWALEGGVKTEKFEIQYGPGKGTEMMLPMPWDKVYLSRWSAFLGQLGERYGKEPSFRVIAADGPSSVSAEMTLPQKPKDMKTWQRNAYAPHRYVEAWQKVLRVYADDFPKQWVSLSVGAGLNINNRGKIDPGEGKRTRQVVIDYAMGILGHRFVLQNSDLSAGPLQHDATAFVMGYSGRVVTGLQLRTSAQRESADMGAAGDPPLALRRSLDLGVKPNQAGQRIDYLEIYEPDVVADDMQPVLRYGASLFVAGGHVAPRESPRN